MNQETPKLLEQSKKISDLNKHDIKCQSNNLLTSLFFKKDNVSGQIYDIYSYSCDKNSINGKEIKKNTQLDDYSDGNIIYLDRHNIECPPSYGLSQLKLESDANHIHYDYKCTETNLTKLNEYNTNFNTNTNGLTENLVKHKLVCQPGEYLNSIKLVGNKKYGKLNEIKYNYKCIGIAPTTTAPTTTSSATLSYNNFLTMNGHGMKTNKKFTIPIKSNIYVLIPHKDGLSQSYTVSPSVNSFERIIFINKNTPNFKYGWKIYYPGDEINDINISEFKKGDPAGKGSTPCADIVKYFKNGNESLVYNCILENNNSCIVYVDSGKPNHDKFMNSDNNKNIYKIKICGQTTLENVIKMLETQKSHILDKPIILIPLLCNSGMNNITLIPTIDKKNILELFNELLTNDGKNKFNIYVTPTTAPPTTAPPTTAPPTTAPPTIPAPTTTIPAPTKLKLVKTEPYTLIGLINVGNSCYMNALLQMIYSIPQFRKIIIKMDITQKTKKDCDKKKILVENFKIIYKKYTELSQIADKTYNNLLTLDINTDIPSGYKNIINVCPTLHMFGQEDAQEFYNYILDAFDCYDTTGKNILNFIRFNEENKVSCINGNSINMVTIPQYILTLGINIPTITNMQDAINNYIAPEYLTPGNDYLEVCGKEISKAKNTNYKKIDIKLLPETDTLIINLKRFEYDLYGQLKKVAKSIIPNKTIVIDGEEFILKGCVIHSGTIFTDSNGKIHNNGHYVYISYDDNSDYNILADDSKIILLNKQKPLAYNDITDGYIFYYKRKYQKGGKDNKYKEKYLRYKLKYLETK